MPPPIGCVGNWMDGSATGPGRAGPTAPVTSLRLRAVEVISAEALQLPLWGDLGEEDRLRARRALVRVQGLLGPEAVAGGTGAVRGTRPGRTHHHDSAG